MANEILYDPVRAKKQTLLEMYLRGRGFHHVHREETGYSVFFEGPLGTGQGILGATIETSERSVTCHVPNIEGKKRARGIADACKRFYGGNWKVIS